MAATKDITFVIPPQSPGSRHVAVFEAPIDALSHATLQELEGWKWNGYRLSLGGTSHVALTSFWNATGDPACYPLYGPRSCRICQCPENQDHAPRG